MSLFKIVQTDNYARETVAERVVEENLSFVEACVFCEALRSSPQRYDEHWFTVMPQSAKLWGGMAEFV